MLFSHRVSSASMSRCCRILFLFSTFSLLMQAKSTRRQAEREHSLPIYGRGEGVLPLLVQVSRSLPVRFTGGNAYFTNQKCYCCRGPAEASSRSRICS